MTKLANTGKLPPASPKKLGWTEGLEEGEGGGGGVRWEEILHCSSLSVMLFKSRTTLTCIYYKSFASH